MMAKIRLPESQQDMERLLEGFSESDLRDLFETNRKLEEQLRLYGPSNDDELHSWIRGELGVNIPRVSVCSDHDAPFQFLADLYFERIDAALGVANRGGAKTFLVAVLHWLNSKFKPGCESCTFGAVEKQSYRAYSHLKSWIFDENGKPRVDIVSSMMSETIFRNGSKVEVLGSTPEQVNGPHPQKAHADEIELMREDTWAESRNMTISGQIRDGRYIRPQDISTSTRKGPNGRVQTLINEITQATREGYRPPRKLYMWCQKETAAERPDCQKAPKAAREARLTELGRDPCETCDCHLVRKGEWDDGKPRLLSEVCDGDFFRSRGWQPPPDIYKQFSENDRETYEAQVLCMKPEMRWHYMPTFSEERNAIKDYVPDPENGPIFTSTDWGGTNPHSVHWYQLLRNEIEAISFLDEVMRLIEGTIVVFDEIYIAEIGNDALGEMVKAKEMRWKRAYPQFRVFERFADPQGKAAKLDWKAMGLRTSWHATREIEEQLKVIRTIMDDNLLRVDERCPMFIKEALAWRRNPATGNELDENFNHAMSDWRYFAINVKKVRNKALNSTGSNLPNARKIPRSETGQVSVRDSRKMKKGPVGFRGKDEDQFDLWRRSLGMPVTRGKP